MQTALRMIQTGSVKHFKTKITAECRDFCLQTRNLRSFSQCPNAACAERLSNQPPIFHNSYLLEIGAKGPAGGTHREAAVMSKCRGFATSIALCHCKDPFVTIIAGDVQA